MTDPKNNMSTYQTSQARFGKRLSDSKLLQLLEIVAVFSPVVLVILGYRSLGIESPMVMFAAVWVANVTMLGLIWLSLKLRGDSWRSIGLGYERPTFSAILRAVLKSIPILIFALVGFIFGTILMANIVGIQEGADMTKYNYLRDNMPMLFISLLGVYFVSSFGEEVVYRGFLITRLQELFGGKIRIALVTALVMSSIIFGFAHFEWGATGVVQTAFMGAALSLSFLWTKRRLWSLILAHGYIDTILLVQLYLAR